jgi:type IV pilus assembly protein PilA
MLLKLRQRLASEESGFTLVELLVVMLIIGLLAAIAIPAFFNQREKTKDTSAKEMARTSETAMETFATDNGGGYAGVARGDLNNIEPSILIANNSNDPYIAADADVSGTATTYTLKVTSQTGNEFTISRTGPGAVTFSCDDGAGNTGKDGCPTSGDWAH